MAKKRETTIEATLRLARQVQPDLWKRTEAVARIIDPAAFATGWVISPETAAKLHAAKLAYLRSNAMCRAQEVLKFLGVNTDTDWFEILRRLAEESSSPRRLGVKSGGSK